jgi:hypothetical protein
MHLFLSVFLKGYNIDYYLLNEDINMKVLAFNCCMKSEHADTAMILNSFITGMTEAGAEVDLIYTSELNIIPCRACTSDPLYISDGKCNCEDDMKYLYPKFLESDIWVFATPNINNHIPSQFKNLLDRMEPLFNIDFERKNGDMEYHLNSSGKIALISTSPAWNLNKFDVLVNHFESFCQLFDKEFVSPVLRPHSDILNTFKQFRIQSDDIYKAAKDAGKMLVSTGRIPVELLKIISRDLAPKDSFIEELNGIVLKKLELK